MCIDTCIDMCIDLCTDMWIDLWIDMWIDICLGHGTMARVDKPLVEARSTAHVYARLYLGIADGMSIAERRSF